jgi:hypothetical protein
LQLLQPMVVVDGVSELHVVDVVGEEGEREVGR